VFGNFNLKYNKTFRNIFFLKNVPTEKVNPDNKLRIKPNTYFYLEYYFALLLHGFLLKNRNRTFSLYPVNHHHFLKGSSFSPSFDNIIKFKKSIFKGQVLNLMMPSLIFLKVIKSLNNKFFFRKFTFIFSLYKNNFLMNVNRFGGILNLLPVNYKSKSHRKLNNIKYALLRYFKKLFYRNNKLILKKKRYLKFLLRTNNFTKKRNFNTKIRLKKLSNFSGIYSNTLNLARFGDNKTIIRFKLKAKINNYFNPTFVDANNCFNTLEFNKVVSILFFF
jgi:hypothetical protein